MRAASLIRTRPFLLGLIVEMRHGNDGCAQHVVFRGAHNRNVRGSFAEKKIVREKAAAWVRPGQQRSLALGGCELRMFFLFLQYAMIHKRTSKQTSEYL